VVTWLTNKWLITTKQSISLKSIALLANYVTMVEDRPKML